MLQCAQVNWIVQSAVIPSDVTISVEDFTFVPAVFEVAPDGCGSNQPSCQGHVFRAGNNPCYLPVRALEGAQSESPTLEVSGWVHCADYNSRSCADFVAALRTETQLAVDLNPLPVTETPTPPPDTLTETTTTGLVESTGSVGATSQPVESPSSPTGG